MVRYPPRSSTSRAAVARDTVSEVAVGPRSGVDTKSLDPSRASPGCGEALTSRAIEVDVTRPPVWPLVDTRRLAVMKKGDLVDMRQEDGKWTVGVVELQFSYSRTMYILSATSRHDRKSILYDEPRLGAVFAPAGTPRYQIYTMFCIVLDQY